MRHSPSPADAFRVAFVPGVMPGKWFEIWAQRVPGVPLQPVPVADGEQLSVLYDGRADMCFVRLPVEPDDLHVIPLYRELPVVVVPKDHVVTAFDEVDVDELADEHLLEGTWTPEQAIALVAAGEGIVVVPKSVARLYQRKDVEHRPVTGVAEAQVGLAWRRDKSDDRVETFVGIVRGRTGRSSRSGASEAPGQAEARTETGDKRQARSKSRSQAGRSQARGRRGRR